MVEEQQAQNGPSGKSLKLTCRAHSTSVQSIPDLNPGIFRLGKMPAWNPTGLQPVDNTILDRPMVYLIEDNFLQIVTHHIISDAACTIQQVSLMHSCISILQPAYCPDPARLASL